MKSKFLFVVALVLVSTSVQAQVPVNCTFGANDPQLLSGTCLSASMTGNYTNFKFYTPKYPLYSDGAYKRRWIYLPEGTKIDTTNPNAWVYPVGTVLWKEFSIDGKKIETRQLRKIAAGQGMSSWKPAVYLWRNDQSDAELLPGLVTDLTASQLAALSLSGVSSKYAAISSTQCTSCHQSATDVALGFNALQLSFDSKRTGHLSLADLGTAKLYSTAAVTEEKLAGDDLDRQVMGYINTNCATCHRAGGSGTGDFSHAPGKTLIKDDNLFVYARSSPGFITPGNPATSRLYGRFSSGSMPANPHKVVDQQTVELLASWIKRLSSL
jgi:mono/diheme cytochrome c family protein